MTTSARNFAAKMPLLFTTGIIIIFSIVQNPDDAKVYAQTSQPSPKMPVSSPSSSSSSVAHGVRITSPVKGQQVPIGDLTISGTSKGNATTNCQVSIIVNDIKPYQNASAGGPGGASDYSKWNFLLTSKYTFIKEGVNKITAKFSCIPNPAVASFYSVNVTGIRTGGGTSPLPPTTRTITPSSANTTG